MGQTMFSAAMVAVALAATGCASWLAPGEELIRRLPVVEMGQPAPSGHEYVLHVPARQPFPVRLAVGGNLFVNESGSQTLVQLRRDLYLYKQWVSFDGRHWESTHGRLQVLISAGLDPSGGMVSIRVSDGQATPPSN